MVTNVVDKFLEHLAVLGRWFDSPITERRADVKSQPPWIKHMTVKTIRMAKSSTKKKSFKKLLRKSFCFCTFSNKIKAY